ncbi:MAG TPA: hypothetical protein VEB39_03640 [Sphingomicrobium sp.]|nr:hypothetical protein [Sphingomicrobium sp.]
MTLIINAATQHFIVHASDRLLTKRVGSSIRVHSNIENKSLIVRIHDAICIIGYTGAAYIGDTITDEWIASTITGLDLSGDFMMRQPGVRGLTLNQLLRRIEAGLRAVVLPPSTNYLGITVSGVRQRGRYSRPFVREFERNRGVVRSGGHMRSPRSPNFHVLSQIGDHGPMNELPLTIGKEFAELGISAEAFRRGMINAIRERSARTKTVGDEVMTVTVRRPPEGWDVVWRFESPRPHFAALVREGEPEIPFRSFFSPWIITPGGISKPSIGNAHLDHLAGGVTIRCGNKEPEAPVNGNGSRPRMLMGASSQNRARLS